MIDPGADGTAGSWRESPRARLRLTPGPERRALTAERRSSTARRSAERARDARVAVIGLVVGALVVASNAVGSTISEAIAAAVALVVALLSPAAGLTSLAFAAPLARPLVVPAPGLYVAMLAVMLFAYVIRLPITRPRLSLPAPEVIILGAFLVYITAQLVGGRIDGPSGLRTSEITSLFARLTEAVVTFGVAYIILRGRSPYPILAVTLLAAVLAATLAVAQIVGAEGVFGELMDPTGSSGRASGAFADPNYFGTYLAAMIVLAVACLIITDSAWLKSLLLLVAGFLSISLLYTQSRGALVALVAGLVALAFTRSRRAGLLAVAGSLLAALLAYPIFAEWRFGETSGGIADLSQVADTSGRTQAWLAGFELFASSPVFGVGLGRWQETASVDIVAHNWYVQVLAELGLVGFVMWALFIGATLVALSRVSRPARSVGLSVLVVWLAASLTLSPPTLYRMTGPVLIVVAAACVADWARGRRSTAEHLSTGQPGSDGRASVASDAGRLRARRETPA